MEIILAPPRIPTPASPLELTATDATRTRAASASASVENTLRAQLGGAAVVNITVVILANAAETFGQRELVTLTILFAPCSCGRSLRVCLLLLQTLVSGAAFRCSHASCMLQLHAVHGCGSWECQPLRSRHSCWECQWLRPRRCALVLEVVRPSGASRAAVPHGCGGLDRGAGCRVPVRARGPCAVRVRPNLSRDVVCASPLCELAVDLCVCCGCGVR